MKDGGRLGTHRQRKVGYLNVGDSGIFVTVKGKWSTCVLKIEKIILLMFRHVIIFITSE